MAIGEPLIEKMKREWIEQGIAEGEITTAREMALTVVEARFGQVPEGPAAPWTGGSSRAAPRRFGISAWCAPSRSYFPWVLPYRPSRAAVDQALFRLARRGTIRRLDRGTYDFPLKSARVGLRSPSTRRSRGR